MALFLQPVFKDRIWGGHALKAFNYDIPKLGNFCTSKWP